jgi:sulfur-oxidizing protein SoxY
MSRGVEKTLAVRRRRLVAGGSVWAAWLACGLPVDAVGAADSGELAFDATSLEQALQAIGQQQVSSAGIVMTLPATADDGAFVAVSVYSALPGTREISIVVEHNPNPLVVQFSVPDGTEPQISTRVKVAASGKVYAVVQADGKVYSTFRDVQVQRGGCG